MGTVVNESAQGAVLSPSGEVKFFSHSVSFDPKLYTESYGNDIDQGEASEAPSENHLLQRHVSLELLNPVYECDTRKSSTTVAIINLVATTCGGGVLSLPLAFQRAGIIPTSILMVFGCLATDFTLYILVSCARRTGGRSYGDVSKAAFGNAAEVATTSLLGLMLIGSLTAYLVLVKDVWSPLILSFLPMSIRKPLLCDESTLYGTDFDPSLCPSKEGANFVLFCILIAGAPLLLKRDLHALRHTCYVGFLSCGLLMIAVLFRAYQAVDSSSQDGRPALNWYSTNFDDYAFAFPIVVLCFFCSYNVLGVHSSLLNPTRGRVKYVLDSSMLLCFILFYLVGLGGYLYALDETRDNILLNFPMHDKAIFLGRMGFCFTLLFALPLVTLPCRDAFRAIPIQIQTWIADAGMAKEFKELDEKRKEGAHLIINGVDFDEVEPLVVTEDPEKQHVTMLTYGTDHGKTHIVGAQDEDEDATAEISDAEMAGTASWSDHKEAEEFEWEEVIHFGLTCALVGLCYIFAISVPGVGFVWSLAGSSLALLIAFIVPTSCYLRIRQHKNLNPRSIAAWGLVVLSCIAAPMCTLQALQA